MRLSIAVLLGVLGVLLVACSDRDSGLPEVGSEEYEEAIAEFYVGVAAIQVGEDVRAERSLNRVVELAPGEPSAPANLALLALQQRRLDDAAEWVERARSAGEDGAQLALLSALIERARGNLDRAIGELRPVVGVADPDPRARFLLHRFLEQRAGPGDVEESRELLEAMLETRPEDTFLRVESARHAARHGQEGALDRELAWLREVAAAWPDPLREQLELVQESRDDPASLGTELTFLAATLDPQVEYAAQRDALAISDQQPDLVFTRLVRLPTPSPRPPEPDLEMAFTERAVDLGAGRSEAGWRGARPVWLGGAGTARIALDGHGSLVLAGSEGEAVDLPLEGIAGESGLAVAPFDLEGDFLMDLAVAGSGGLRVFVQGEDESFSPAPSGALPEPVRSGDYRGVWAMDSDVDGDLDLVLSPRGETPFLLRNRGNGTFVRVPRFSGVSDVVRLAWGDMDRSGVADAVFLDSSGRVHLHLNPRQNHPTFQPVPTPDELHPARGIGLGDLTGDGRLELVVLRDDGALMAARYGDDGWNVREAARWEGLPAGDDAGHVFVVDLDNSGALDVVASVGGETRTWLSDSAYQLREHRTLQLATTAAADLAGGRIELLGVDSEARPLRLTPSLTRNYYALTIGPRATDEPGDGRINSFGIGGEAEIRAGMLYQKQIIAHPFVHFGLGSNTGVSVARILWPNGTAQAEFDLLASSEGEPVVAQQRLKGSCPWLFTFDGQEMVFVTDLAWRTALGLRINAYGSSAVIQSQDWVRVRGDQLEARDGVYEMSITADLWESHFFDYVALQVVDHPEGTEALVDERFFLPPPELAVRPTGSLQSLAGAWDQDGRDVLPIVSELDEQYVDGFELGSFQGVTAEEHFVEVELGPDASPDAPLVLVAQGWVFPTDGSLNFAMGQGDHPLPRGIRVDVPNPDGGWRVLHEDLGMPAGKTKTVLVDLDGAFDRGVPRRVRLAATMEIYWDRITWAETLGDAGFQVTKLHPRVADLRPRGFSRSDKPDRRSPELPVWDIQTTVPQWRDLEGYHTRFGDVLPLMEEIDDRYVIMNAGDELRLEFEAPPDPPEGWTRTYVFISEAWVKDGDFNNGFSTTLLPLPYQGMADYSTPPGRLQDDPVYQRFPEDWRHYHTRWVSSEPFEHVLSTR
ncbi:MAG: FG-GAP-like repeat-containing protein [Gemmatimonadota bacterium]